MKLCITAGNYHIFKLMIKNHKDSRIQLKNIHPLDFDLVFDVYTSLDQKTVISILSHELRYSPFMYLCPGFKVIPLKKRLPSLFLSSTDINPLLLPVAVPISSPSSQFLRKSCQRYGLPITPSITIPFHSIFIDISAIII